MFCSESNLAPTICVFCNYAAEKKKIKKNQGNELYKELFKMSPDS